MGSVPCSSWANTIDDDVWTVVQGKVVQCKEVVRAKSRGRSGRTLERGPSAGAVTEFAREKGGRPAFYLLSSLIRCNACNGPLTVIKAKQGKQSIKMYACARRRNRGGTVCLSTRRREVDALNALVLNWVRDNVVTEEYVTEVLAEARRRFEARSLSREGDTEPLERMAKKLRSKVDKFAEMALQAPLSTRAVVCAKVRERQKQLADVAGPMRTTAIEKELAEVEREAWERFGKPGELPGRYTVEMRAAVRAAQVDSRNPRMCNSVELQEALRGAD